MSFVNALNFSVLKLKSCKQKVRSYLVKMSLTSRKPFDEGGLFIQRDNNNVR